MTDGRGRGSAPGVDDDLLFDLEYEQSDRRRSASGEFHNNNNHNSTIFLNFLSADSCRFDGRVDQQDTSQVIRELFLCSLRNITKLPSSAYKLGDWQKAHSLECDGKC